MLLHTTKKSAQWLFNCFQSVLICDFLVFHSFSCFCRQVLPRIFPLCADLHFIIRSVVFSSTIGLGTEIYFFLFSIISLIFLNVGLFFIVQYLNNFSHASGTVLCEICQSAPSKYTCPGCDVKTCSVTCVKEHKTRLGCSGERNRLAFVDMTEYSDRHLLNGKFLTDSWPSC